MAKQQQQKQQETIHGHIENHSKITKTSAMLNTTHSPQNFEKNI